MKQGSTASQISDIVNNTLFHPLKTGVELTTEHHYLVNEMFKMFVHFAGQLARNYDKEHYDERNQYACECSRIIIDALKEKGKYDEKWFNQLYDEFLQKSNF